MKVLLVHDEADQAKVGDKVRIMETRPLSRMKRWRLIEVIKPGTGPAAPVNQA